MGQKEASVLPGSGNWQVVHVLTPDGCLGGSKISRMSGLTAGFSGHQAGGTEDAWNHGLRVLESRYVLTSTAQLLKEDSVPGGEEWIVAASPGRRRDRAGRG
jgi:hypothetical protein